MKWTCCVALSTALIGGQAMADSCWTLTGMKGKTAFSDDDYKVIDDGMSKSTFILHINRKSPSVEIAGGTGTYDGGKFFMVSEEMLIFISADGGSTAEVWSVDMEKKVGLMTKSRVGYGPLNKAALFVGKAVPSC